MLQERPTRKLYIKWMRLNKFYKETKQLFEAMGDQKYLTLIADMEIWLEECKQDLIRMERVNFQKLEQFIASGEVGHGVATWYEDEYNDLWDGLR